MEYVISDLHLGHTNIIKYCHRPFRSVEHMNAELIDRWNNTVTNDDTVYYLGDISVNEPYQWLKQLNGNIVLIRGNHDKRLKRTRMDKVIEYNGEKFLLIHTPYWIDREWDGWVIHGHHHNNETNVHPLCNKKTKMFNVCVELIDYTPIELGKLLELREKEDQQTETD